MKRIYYSKLIPTSTSLHFRYVLQLGSVISILLFILINAPSSVLAWKLHHKEETHSQKRSMPPLCKNGLCGVHINTPKQHSAREMTLDQQPTSAPQEQAPSDTTVVNTNSQATSTGENTNENNNNNSTSVNVENNNQVSVESQPSLVSQPEVVQPAIIEAANVPMTVQPTIVPAQLPQTGIPLITYGLFALIPGGLQLRKLAKMK